MLGMRIIVSTTAIPFEWVKDHQFLKESFIQKVAPFKSSGDGLGIYSELHNGELPTRMVGINVPNYPLCQNKAKGVAGPGKPAEELFVGPGIDNMKHLAGTYDKWRPYPAEELTDYAIKMAKKFAKKRCRMFIEAGDTMSWDVLVYVDHAPASIAHLSKDATMNVVYEIFSNTIKVSRAWPTVPVVLFSPYGVDDLPGFVVSNTLDVTTITNWDGIRGVFNGSRKAD